MLKLIYAVIWIVFLYNLFAIIGYIFLGKFMFATNIIWLRALTNPSETADSVGKAAKGIVKHSLYTIASGILLFLIYF